MQELAVTTSSSRTATKTTTDGTEKPEYVPINIEEHTRSVGPDLPVLAELKKLLAVREAMADMGAVDKSETADAAEAVEWLVDLIQRAEGEQVVVPSPVNSAVYDVKNAVSSLEIGPATFTSEMKTGVRDDFRSAVRDGFTMDLAHVSDEDWESAGLAGMAESSSGMVHLVDTDGELCCGHGSPAESPSIERRLTDVTVECSTCQSRFYRFLRDDLRYGHSRVTREIRDRAELPN